MKIKKGDLTTLVVMVVIIVALIYFIPKFTGDAVQSIPCVDSDGGKIFTVQGTVQKGVSVRVTDYCLDEVQLREHYCSESDLRALEVEFYNCPNGCSNGACIETTTTSSANGALGAEKPFVSLSNVWFWIVLAVVLIVLFLILKKLKK